MDFKGIVESQEGNELALKYADAIIAGLPPKQGELQRMAITKLCQLLFVEGKIAGTLQQIDTFTGIIKSPISEIAVIKGFLMSKQNGCDRNPMQGFTIRPEVLGLPLSLEGSKLCEIALMYFDTMTGSKDQQCQACTTSVTTSKGGVGSLNLNE